MKSIKTSVRLALIIGLILPGYVNANAEKASTLRKKAVAMSVVAGACYWYVLKIGVAGSYSMAKYGGREYRGIYSLITGAALLPFLGAGMAASWYAHKLRQARKQELQKS